jgi:hypothetical protein
MRNCKNIVLQNYEPLQPIMLLTLRLEVFCRPVFLVNRTACIVIFTSLTEANPAQEVWSELSVPSS